MSILSGIGKLVDNWLKTAPKGQPPYYRHRSAANELSAKKEPITGTLEFLEASYKQINNNWLAAIEAGYSEPSKENWRWKRHTELAVNNKSPELQLERAIVNHCGDNWSNQMPTASRLVGPATDKRAAVDLVYRDDPTTYSLIELKVDSDNPLFAAIEILMYGLVFTWSRNHHVQLSYDIIKQPVLKATTITFCVLAPANYYAGLDLTNLALVLNTGLVKFGKRREMVLGFEFSQLGSSYAADLTAENIRSAISNKHSIWGTKK